MISPRVLLGLMVTVVACADIKVASDPVADSTGAVSDTRAVSDSSVVTGTDTSQQLPDALVGPDVAPECVLGVKACAGDLLCIDGACVPRPPTPEPDCVGEQLVACADGAGPSGLGDAVLVCRGGEVQVTTCWEYCQQVEGLPRTGGCRGEGANVSCQCLPADGGECMSANSQRFCNPPLGCGEQDCDDYCGGGARASIGCGLVSDGEFGRREGCLCACDAPGAGKCTREFAPTCNTPGCPHMGICDAVGVWRGINQTGWCALRGEVPNEAVELCQEDVGQYLCRPASGCTSGSAVCASGLSLAVCEGGAFEIRQCPELCASHGYNAASVCTEGDCGCWDNPCPEPNTPWSCGGGVIERCYEGSYLVQSCEEYCDDRGLAYKGSCVTNAGGERACSCISKAQAACSSGYWSGGGASCNAYWNGVECCENCMLCTPGFGCSAFNSCD